MNCPIGRERFAEINRHGLERRTQWLLRDAQDTCSYVRTLTAFPYAEKTGEAIRTAETALTEALLAVKVMAAEYERLAVKASVQ